jgi:hypothetical protein
LPPLAQAILQEAIADSGDSPFVFQTQRVDFRPMTRGTASNAFTNLRGTLGISDRVRLHYLLVDQLAAIGVPSEYRSHVLHLTSDMRATLAAKSYSTYDHMAEKRRALEMWERRLLAIVQGQELPSERW